MYVKLYIFNIISAIVFNEFLIGFSNEFNKAANNFDRISISEINFAFNTYRKLSNSNEKNVIFSPLSLSIGLTALLQGAKGQTFNEIHQLLQYDARVSMENKHKVIARHIKTLQKSDTNCVINFASRLYIQKNLDLKQDFLHVFSKYYKGGLRTIDFYKSPTKAKNSINKWISKKTNGEIPELFKELDPRTRLVLANALYFEGMWNIEFSSNTREENFTTSNGQIMKTFMMTLSHSKFNYAEIYGLNCQIIELPYKGFNYSMIILLPRKIDGLKDLEKHLNYTTFKDMRSQMLAKSIQKLKIPKFKFDKVYKLIPVFTEMGYTTAFDNNANFSGISADGLKISDIAQQAVIEVHEKGTKAVAATSIFEKTSFSFTPNVEFVANHPFIFIIWNKRDNNILFMGKFVNPKE